jgi:hypothetical protein
MKKPIIIIAILCVIALGLGYWSGLPKLKKGLVAYYPFNGNANDESGNGNDGEVKGATLTTDRHGEINAAYSFSIGKNSFVRVTESVEAPWSTVQTISLWVSVSNNNRRDADVLIRNDRDDQPSGKSGWNVYLNRNSNGSTAMRWFTGGQASRHIEFDSPVGREEWFNLTVLNKKEAVQFYVNGTLIKETQGKISLPDRRPNGYPLLLGGWRGRGDVKGLFEGLIDDVRIYNRALSADEVKALYDLEKPKGK